MPGRIHVPHVLARIEKNHPKLEQRGDVQTPAGATTSETVTTVPLPAGSSVTIAPSSSKVGSIDRAPETQPVTVTLSQPSELRTETRTEAVEGAKSFPPPSPPTPTEIARGKGVLAFYIAGGVCAVLAILGFSMGFPRAGVACAVGALGIPLLGVFVGSQWAMLVGGIAAAGAFAYWHSHHIHSPLIAEAESKAEAVEAKTRDAIAPLLEKWKDLEGLLQKNKPAA